MTRAIAILAFVTVAGIGAPAGLAQQAPPATEIYLSRVMRDGSPAVAGAIDISNNPGYDNQPSFTPDGKAVLFTSNRDGKQTDIYRYDIATKTLTQLTHTPESEYSPLVTPDGRTFSVIRVEADGAQRLWRFDLDGSNPRVVLENVKPVGYHAWIDATHLALFVLGAAAGDPFTLQIADTTTGKADVIESGIGRSLSMRPGTQALTFVSKPQGAPWVIKTLDTKTRTVTSLTETVQGSEDFAWDPAGQFVLMASGSKIFRWSPAGAAGWKEEGDLAADGVGRITRLAMTPDPELGSATRLALVGEPIKK